MPTNFKELVTWATWQVIQGLTRGDALHTVMHQVLDVAVRLTNEWRKDSA